MEWYEILLIVLGSIVVFLALVLVVGGLVVHNKMFGNRYEHDPLIKMYTKEMFDLDAKPIEFKIKKDTLKGFIYSHKGYNENVIIIYCHGMWSSHLSYMQNIGYLASQGYQVMSFDYLGVNYSEGRNIIGFGSSLKCLDYLIRFIKNNPELKDKDIYVVGHSWGGFATSNIVKYHPDIKGIVPTSPVIGVSELMKGMLPKPLWIFAYLTELIDFLKCGKYSYANAVDSLKKYQGKALFIHSKDDHVVNYNYATKIVQEKSKNPNVKYLIVENKLHQPHYTIESCKKLFEFNNNIRNLKGEELEEYKKTVDYLSIGEVDPSVMHKVIEMIEND